MASRINYFKRLSQAALKNIQLLNKVRVHQHDQMINLNKGQFKSFSINKKTDVIHSLKKDFS